MAVDAQSVVLSYDSLSHATLCYLLRTAPVSTRANDTAIHTLSLCFGQVSHLSDILVVVDLKHLKEPHDQPRCNDHQHLKVHTCWCLCPHPRCRVRRMRCPRECALCIVFIPPYSLLAFPLATLQSAPVVFEFCTQLARHCTLRVIQLLLIRYRPCRSHTPISASLKPNLHHSLGLCSLGGSPNNHDWYVVC